MTRGYNWNNQLAALTAEHQNSLLFCWKIHMGLRKGVELSRIKTYVDWFFENHLLPHLEKEEQMLIHILGESDPVVIKSFAQHRRLKRLFLKKNELLKQLNSIEEELERNIRFEETKLFRELRVKLNFFSAEFIHNEEDLPQIQEEWQDCFWK